MEKLLITGAVLTVTVLAYFCGKITYYIRQNKRENRRLLYRQAEAAGRKRLQSQGDN